MSEERIKALLAKAGDTRKALPTPAERKAIGKVRKEAQEKSAGDAWYGLCAPKMTPELEKDVRLLQMRSAIDPKTHYKRNTDKIGKHFALGTIQSDPLNFYSERLSRKQRAPTLVDALLKDSQRLSYLKRKFTTLQKESRAGRTKGKCKK